MTPNYITELFSTCQNDMYGLKTNNRKRHLPKPKTDFLKKNFSHQGALAWNKLLHEVVDNSGVARKIDNWGAHAHIFVFTYLQNNRFLKKLITQNTNI